MKCDNFDFNAFTNNEISQHMKEKNSKSLFACEFCSVKLKTKEGLHTHVQLFHDRKHMYKCDECDFEDTHEPELVRHYATCYKSKTYNDKVRSENDRGNSDKTNIRHP